VASAPGRDDGRPRVLRRVVRRLAGRLLSDRWRPSAPGPAMSAQVAGTLPVRAPWSVLRWWQRMRRRPASPAAATAAATAPAPRPAGRPIGAPPTMLRRSPALARSRSAVSRSAVSRSAAASSAAAGSRSAGRGLTGDGPAAAEAVGAGHPNTAGSPEAAPGGLARRLLAGALARLPFARAHRPLTGAPDPGPDVRPGHDLILRPAFGRSLGADPAPSAHDGPGGHYGRGHSGDGDSGRGHSGHGHSGRLPNGIDAARRISDPRAAAAFTGPGPGSVASTAPGATRAAPRGSTPGRLGRTALAAGARGLFGAGGPLTAGANGPTGTRPNGPTVTGPDGPAVVGPGGLLITRPAGRSATDPAAPAASASGLAATGSTAPADLGWSAPAGPGRLRAAMGRLARAGTIGRTGAGGPGTASTETAPGAARGSLASRPVSGPQVHSPHPAENLRVLGAATLPPGSEPDPTGAVSVSPARPGGAAQRSLLGGYASVPVPEKASPRDRWAAAVAARPLEAPRPLPSALHAMASAITGRARPPLFTTGPATRNALAAAGALGATTGTVVHLPSVPAAAPAMSAVLAHELMHTRSPVRRPRFLLDGMSGLLDDDERQALAAGRDRLAGAGSGLLGAGQGLVESGRQRVADALPSGAGIVDQLPVGGGLGAVGDVATRAAKAAMLEATSGPLGAAQGWAGGAQNALTGAVDSASGMASGAMSAASGAVDSATDAVSGAAGQAMSAVQGAVQTAGGLASGGKNAMDPDKIVEIVESRLLREIERRGGRWAGMF